MADEIGPIRSATGQLDARIVLCHSIYIEYRCADRIARLRTTAGPDIMLRLAAFTLMGIGLELIWPRDTALIATLPRA
jgi:hypothetical protein